MYAINAFYIIFALLVILIFGLLKVQKEGYFTYYSGMPIIPKTYISPHFILNQSCYQNERIN